MSDQLLDPTIDRSKWDDGPWQTEPDRVEWDHAGLPCLALRNHHGVWCGYAAVPPGHPLHGVEYGTESAELAGALDALKARSFDFAKDYTFARGVAMLFGDVKASPGQVFDVHGGLNYSDKCEGAICHVPKAGAPDDVWWFGFDCGHAGDFSPGMHASGREMVRRGIGVDVFSDEPYDHAKALASAPFDMEGVYRTLAYVQAEVNKLADQLAAVGRA